MSEDTDLRFDIDALFDHMVTNLGHELDEEKDWCFAFQADDLAALQEAANDVGGEYVVQLDPSIDIINEDGTTLPGPPLLTVMRRAALTADEVKSIASTMQSLADKRALSYEGVSCYDPMDETELLDWIVPEDATWRLRVFTDSGMPEDAELPWTFLLIASELESLQQTASVLHAAGYTDQTIYDDVDDSGNYALCLFVAGRNNEAELSQASTTISEAAEAHGAWLEGIQFYDREEFDEVFGDQEGE